MRCSLQMRASESTVARYIFNQQEHHKKITFLEYKRILDKLHVAYEDRYIFRLPEDE